MFTKLLAVSCLCLGLAGCGGPAPVVTTQTAPQVLADKAEIKQRLEGVAQSGNSGSALAGMREGIEKLGDKALLSDFDQLEKASTPEQVKQIAARMISKL